MLISGQHRILFFQEDYEIHNEAIDHLRMLYGQSLTFTRFDEKHKVIFSICLNEALLNFESPHCCAMNLSQIRVQAVGAPILKALKRIDWRYRNQDSEKDEIYKLGSYGKCGTFHCISTSKQNPFFCLINCRVIIVFVVSFEEEIERCLARLFLQQFEITQRKIPWTPYCEFRRSNQITKELRSIIDNRMNPEHNQTLPSPVGFLSFTFFPSSAACEERHLKAVDLLVNFLPYMDRHVKSTKSMMLNTMRFKRYDLLASLKDPVALLSR